MNSTARQTIIIEMNEQEASILLQHTILIEEKEVDSETFEVLEALKNNLRCYGLNE